MYDIGIQQEQNQIPSLGTSSEAGQNSFENEITEIQTNAKSLEENSDKLRENMNKIFALFGKDGHCVKCSKNSYENKELMHHKYSTFHGNGRIYADTLEEMQKIIEKKNGYTTRTENGKMEYHFESWPESSWNTVDEEENVHIEKRATPVRIDVEDTLPFFVKTRKDGSDMRFFLTIRNGKMMIVMKDDGDENEEIYSDLDDFAKSPSRNLLKNLMQSGRIPKFLQLVREELEKNNKEYEEVAGLAEKLVAAMEVK